MSGPVERVAARSTAYGAGLVGLGVLLLLALRFLASPIARRILDREPAGFVEFLGIPAFFVLVGIGVALFLWEPDR